MTFDEFRNKYYGKKVGNGQCVALVKQYIDEVIGVKSKAIGNAKDYFENFNNTYLKNYFTKISNTPDLVPQKGDVVVWSGDISSTQDYGHIAIATGQGDTHNFVSFDQNWGRKIAQDIRHTYNAVYGVLRPLKDVNNSNNNSNNSNKISLNDIYSPDIYISKYGDLQKMNVDELYNHLIRYGIKEGRVFSYVFDAKFYANKYADLKKAYGNDYMALFNHYITWGFWEGRQASAIYDPNYYLENNLDVKNVFGNDYKSVLNHFLRFGMKEGRLASKDFNVKIYKEKNLDIKKSLKDDMQAYFRHYIISGIDEKRICK